MDVPSRVPPGCPRAFPGRYIPLQQYCRFPLEEARAKLPTSGSPGCPRVFPGRARRVPVAALVLSMHQSSLLSSFRSPGRPRGFPGGVRRGCLAASPEASDVIAESSRRSDRRADGGDLVGYPLEQ